MYKPMLEVGDLLWVMEEHKYIILYVDAAHDAYSIKYITDSLIHNTASIQATDEMLVKGRWGYKKMKKINDFKKAIDSL